MTTFLTRACGGKHDVCTNNINYFKNSMVNLTKINFEKFIDAVLTNGNYNNCLSNYSNKNSNVIFDFITLASSMVEIPVAKFISIMQYAQGDDYIKNIIENQVKINSNFKKELINCKVARSYYGNTTLFMSQCISSQRINTFKCILKGIDVSTFFEIVNQTKESLPIEYEKFIMEYINNNEKEIKKYDKLNSTIESLINKPKILKYIYTILAPTLTPDKKLDILNKVVSSNILDPELILIIMEGKDVVATNITLINLLSKVYFRTVGAHNAKIIAEIIDIFIMYGFKITKEIVITLLRKGCYINRIEKYPIEIDESILEICAELSYYPYDFNCIPPAKVMLKECSKNDNLIQIKKLKEKGGIIDILCLEKACGVKKNGKVIKYIVNECKVNPNDKCLEEFQATYGIDALDLVMKNYSNLKTEPSKVNKLELNDDATMSIERKNIEINNDEEYILKNKIKKFFDYKKNTITFKELNEIMLKYLIKNKLIIGNYFLINSELHNLTKVNQCTLVNIDQLENVLSYFIDKNC